MLSTSQLRAAWSPACRLSSPVTLNLHGKGRVHVDGRTRDAVAALNRCLVAWNYQTRRADTGAYNCRRITGGSGFSLHAYGIALDLNWTSNPYRADNRLVTDMPAAMVGAICAIRTVNGRQVWGWGGNYRTIKDAMHFEIVCRPADLATGIRWSSVPSASPGAVDVSWVPVVIVPQSSRATENGRGVQRALNILAPVHGAGLLAVDGIVGPRTVNATRAFQTWARSMQRVAGETNPRNLIVVDGIWGRVTGTAARFWIPVVAADR